MGREARRNNANRPTPEDQAAFDAALAEKQAAITAERQQRPAGEAYRVRTGEEVAAEFETIHALLERLHDKVSFAEQMGKTFEQREAQAIREGRRVEHSDGSVSVRMTPYVQALTRCQILSFEFKFGREMGKGDPIFFDADAAEPKPFDADEDIAMLRAVATKAGLDPDAVHRHFWGREDLADYKKKVQ